MSSTWKLLTAEEAANQLSIPVKKLYELIQQGLVRSVRIGRLHKIHPNELDRFVAEQSEVAR
jgi:excisionase family DNA binding protein